MFLKAFIYIIYGNELTSVVLHSSIEEIIKDSFVNNPNLKQITLLNPNTVSYDGEKITDGQQLNVGTKDNPEYATIKYQK